MPVQGVYVEDGREYTAEGSQRHQSGEGSAGHQTGWAFRMMEINNGGSVKNSKRR